MKGQRAFGAWALSTPNGTPQFRTACRLLKAVSWFSLVPVLYFPFWVAIAFLVLDPVPWTLADVGALMPVAGVWGTCIGLFILSHRAMTDLVLSRRRASATALLVGVLLVSLAAILLALGLIPGLIGIVPPGMPILLAYPRVLDHMEYLAFERWSAMVLVAVLAILGTSVLVSFSSLERDRELLLRACMKPRWVYHPKDAAPRTWACPFCGMQYNVPANARPPSTCEICQRQPIPVLAELLAREAKRNAALAKKGRIQGTDARTNRRP